MDVLRWLGATLDQLVGHSKLDAAVIGCFPVRQGIALGLCVVRIHTYADELLISVINKRTECP